MIRVVVSNDGESLGSGDYEADRVQIGSAPDNDLQIEAEGVSPHHVEVWLWNGVGNIRSPDDGELTVAGERLAGKGVFRDGDAVLLGTLQFVFFFNPAREASETRQYRTGRVKLRGGGVLELPEAGGEAELVEVARQILVDRSAGERELQRLEQEGASFAQQVVLQAEERTEGPPPEKPRRRKSERIEQRKSERLAKAPTSAEKARVKRRLALTLVLVPVASVLGWLMLEQVIYLVQAFQE